MPMPGLESPRFPEPDPRDIGRGLAAGCRRQVLLAAEREAEDWVAHLPDGHPARDEQEQAVVVLRELREREREREAA